MTSLMDHYWTLASDNPEDRINAAEALIQGLVANQSQEDWDYALNRLITGLSSSRGSARLGFSMALSEVLDLRKDKIKINDYLEKAAKAFVVTGSMKGAEERGLLFGKLFALQTLAKSSLWSNASLEDFEQFVAISIDLSLKKQWLREPTFYALGELVGRLDSLSIDRKSALKFLFSKIHEKDLTLTCEGVAIALTVSPEERIEFNSEFGWKTGDPLAKPNLVELARVLKDMPVGDNKQQQNKWKPSVHFVWARLLSAFMSNGEAEDSAEPPKKKQKKEKSKKSKKQSSDLIQLGEFWRATVDEGFFAAKASPERKMWGFEILNQWLPQINEVGSILSPNLTRSLSNQLAQSDRFLHKMAKRVVSTFIEVATEKGNAGAIVEALLKQNLSYDKLSKSKTVSDLLPLVKNDTGHLVDVLLGEFETQKEKQGKQLALDLIVNILKNKKSDDTEWVKTVLDRLVPIAYFSAEDESFAELAQQRITSILSATMNHSNGTESLAYYVLQRIQTLEAEGKTARIEFEGDVLKAKEKAEATVEKIQKKRLSSRHVDSPQLRAFVLLFSMVLIQVYSTDAEAVSILEELQIAYNNFAGKARQTEDEVDTEVDTGVVLTEILISFLSQQSALLRKLSEDVWSSFSEQISLESLQLLFDIIATTESLEGQDALFDVDDDDVEMEDEEEEDEEDEDEDEDEEDEEEDEDDSESEGDIAVDEEAERALAKTLGVKNEDDDDDEEEDDDDMEDDDEESMDDEQMAALDDQLSAIFKERQKQLSSSQQKKKDTAKAKHNITLLKSRALDLLDIYVTKQPESLAGLSIFVPALNAMQVTKDQTVGDKARDLIRNRLCRKTNYTLKTQEEVTDVVALLDETLKQAVASQSKPHSLTVNQVGVFATKLLLNFDKSLIEVVAKLYSEALVNWVEQKKNKTTPNLFIDLVNFLASKR